MDWPLADWVASSGGGLLEVETIEAHVEFNEDL